MAARLVVLHGPDEFAAAEALEQLRAGLGDPGLVALNTTTLDGRSLGLGELREACDALPFLAPRRLVVVEGLLTRLMARTQPPTAAGEADGDGEAEPEAEAAEAARPGLASARELQAGLITYLPGLPESTLLVLVEKRELPATNPVLKSLAGAPWAEARYFDVPRGDALVRWILARARAAGGELTREAAEALADAEADPRALGHEILKLLTYVAFERRVELDDVQLLTTAGGEANIFALVDAIGQRRGAQAQRELRQILADAHPMYVFTMIVRQYRLLLQVKELLGQRASEGDVARALGLKPYPAGKLCTQARSYGLAGLEQTYRRLLEVEVEMKTGQMEPATALDALVGALTA